LGNNNKKSYFRIALVALLFELGTSPLRSINFILCAVVTFILFFILIFFLLKKYRGKLKSEYVLLFSLIGCSFLQLPIRIFLPSTKISLPDFIFHLLGIILGYLFYKSGRIFRIIILVISLLSCFFLFFSGYDMWLNKLNYKTFTGIIDNDDRKYNLQFQTNTGDTLSLSDYEGKYLLLDCWYTHCGYCYQAMPEMQKLYHKYKGNEKVVISSMHSYIEKEKEDYTSGSQILKKRYYTFPCLAIAIDNPVLKELGVNSYPTVLIFDKQSNLIFRGDIEYAKKRIEKYSR
jgi:thiol-disulfide isomerase/thioredoxin